ncbi:hypothetical protein BTO06_11840 [Tenacibaculum sp. SZ-18]|uniref:FEKKY domain-containing protein n=1 Tax=Tenacibaculum sp. SZ-18 TaxID=754423 RepID=UPI000C2D5A05|nr:hypothetical protein [Tenacibaculum sp. SZ-18]AUC15797.1 hypothetical protein BTO06_11840 [Tenacibaculum sp. SZ-18]
MEKLKNTYLIIFCSLIACGINAQSEKDSTELKKPIFTHTVKVDFKSDFNIEGAKKAIKKEKIRILFPGGFGGMPDFDNEKDIAFQKKYSVEFFSQGCIRMGEDENEEEYNQTIFAYLDKKYGKKWRNEIRDGAIGIK